MKAALGIRAYIVLGVAAIVLGFASQAPGQTDAGGCAGPASYSWSGSVISWGVRDYAVEVCGPDSLDVLASAQWRGGKGIALVLVEPDGTLHVYTGAKGASGVVDGPLASGTWTLVVRNLTPSNVRFDAELTLQ